MSNDEPRVDVLQAMILDSLAPSTRAVTLSGHVDSWVEHHAAVSAAWAAPGVRAVQDRIVVDYRA